MANVEDQVMAENGTMDHTPEDEDGEPETKRAKVEATEDLENSLESESEDLAKELTCPLCKGHFKDPVIISCSHNFCRTCIEEAWSGQESFVCPDCETVITEKMCIPNRALENLVKKSISTATVNSPATPKPIEMTMIPANCPEHDERLKLFCKEDGALSCLICRDSLKHSGHNFLPIMDAVEVYRTQLSAVTAPLQEALKATRQLNSQQREKIQQAKTNVEECEQHVVTEFKKLKDFIEQQKETLLKQLKEQGKDVVTQMENNLTQVQENEQNIEQAISLANEKMSVTEASSFLTDTKSIIDKCREQQARSSISILVDKKLNESTYKGPVLSSVWKEMKSLVSPNGDISEAEPGGSLRGLFSTIGVPQPSPSFTIDRTRGGFLFPWKPASDGDAESGDQDNLAAQAPEKPETGAQANQQSKPATPGTAPKTGAQANQQSKPATPSTAPKTVAGGFARPASSTPSTSSQPSQKVVQKSGQTSQVVPAAVSSTGMQRTGQTSQGIPAAVPSTAAKHVWLIGTNFLVEAKKRAQQMPYGLNLGLQQENVTVHWFGEAGMQWLDVQPKLRLLDLRMKPPDVLIIHMGYDMKRTKYVHESLIKVFQDDLTQISSRYSNTVVLWSSILPSITEKKDLQRKKLNKALADYAAVGRYGVISHPVMEFEMQKRWQMLYRKATPPPDSRPCALEIDILNKDFKSAIRKAITRV